MTIGSKRREIKRKIGAKITSIRNQIGQLRDRIGALRRRERQEIRRINVQPRGEASLLRAQDIAAMDATSLDNEEHRRKQSQTQPSSLLGTTHWNTERDMRRRARKQREQ